MITQRRFALAVLSIVIIACAGAGLSGNSRDLPLTRAERSNYLETSKYSDVVAFLDSLTS